MKYYLTETGNGTSVDDTMPAGAVECRMAQYLNAKAWTVADGKIIAVDQTGPTVAQQAIAALKAGCAIMSMSAPGLNGTYPTDGLAWTALKDEATFVALTGGFSSGAPSITFLLKPGWSVTFGALAHFQAVYQAIGSYRTALRRIIETGDGALPTPNKSIP
jgi:hypothetical protein